MDQNISTTNPLLAKLHSPEFNADVGVVSSARGLRRCLHRLKLVSQLKRAISGGAISERMIEGYVNGLLKDFERGKRFPHELPLAALAIAIEDRKTKFAEDFLLDLARLNKICEMTFAPTIAAASLSRWYKLPRVKVKEVPRSADRIASTRSPVAEERWREVRFWRIIVKVHVESFKFEADKDATT